MHRPVAVFFDSLDHFVVHPSTRATGELADLPGEGLGGGQSPGRSVCQELDEAARLEVCESARLLSNGEGGVTR